MKKEYITTNKEETQGLAKEMLSNLDGRNVILLQGELGAGKTTFAQGLLEHVGAKGPFTSPTFVIMKEYGIGKSESGNRNREFKRVFHIDAYRVEVQDILDIGWEEMISDEKNLVLVEWPERIKKIWPKKYMKLDFESGGEDERNIYFNIY